MLSDALITISEGKSLKAGDWCDHLKIQIAEFNDLVNRNVFAEIDKGEYRNTFVGTIKTKSHLIYSLPKCFFIQSLTDDRILKNAIRLIERSLRLYKKRIENSRAIKEEENFFLTIRNLTRRTE